MSRSFDRAVQAIIGDPLFTRARIGIAIHDLDNDQILYETDADAFFHAASTTKIFTVAHALARLGTDYRFRTVVRYTGHIAAGVVHGDVVLIACGDPNISARVVPGDRLSFCNIDHAQSGAEGAQTVPGDPLVVLRNLALQIASRGIHHIAGCIYVDVSMFPEDLNLDSDGTERVASPIVVNDNLVDVLLVAGAELNGKVSVALSPDPGDVTVVNTVRITPAGTPTEIQLSSTRRSPAGMRVLELTGTMAARATQLFSFAVDAPSRHAVTMFKQVLLDAGVTAAVGDGNYTIEVRALHGLSDEVIAEHVSPPFSEAAKVTLKLSNNLHAKLLPRIVGAVYGSMTGPGADARGFAAEAEFLDALGVGCADALQADASGGLGLFTPDFVCRFLRSMQTLPIYGAFRAALPILGVDGTLHDIQVSSPAAGHVFAKTGTLSFPDKLRSRAILVSKALAGYIDAASGSRLVFAAYVNNVGLTAASDVHIIGECVGRIATAAYEAF